MTYAYDYEHQKWAAALKKGVTHCHICRRPFAGPRGGKLRRKHAHHIFGAGVSDEGVVLCPSCHELVTILSGRGGKVYTQPAVRRRLYALVKQRGGAHA